MQITCEIQRSDSDARVRPSDSVQGIRARRRLSAVLAAIKTAIEKEGGVGDSDRRHMDFDQAYHWLVQSERRKRILLDFDQPLTATHISRRTGIPLDACLHLLWSMTAYGVLDCLNPDTRFSRLHWLTNLGKECQRRLRLQMDLRPIAHRVPDVSWDLFSSVCYRHRAAVLKAMQGPMQAAAIKRRAVFQDPHLRMSANNVRDIMRYFVPNGIVRKLTIRVKRHPHYELADLGRTFQALLVGSRAYHGLSGAA